MIRLITYLLTLAAVPLFADPLQPVVVDAVTDRYRPLPFEQQKLAGLLSKRLRANSEGYLEHVSDQLSQHIGSADSKAQTALFGQQAGKFLEASANAYEYRRDEHLRAVMDRVAERVIAAQAAHEHWNNTVAGDRWSGQDLLVHKYDLLGLLAYYRVTADDNALTSARQIGDMLVNSLPKGSAGRAEYRRAATLIEPLVLLYRFTEDGRYLELSRSAADAWLQSKETHRDPAAENLSELHALLDLYRITGDESYFRPVPSAWAEVRNRWLSLTGNPLSNGEVSTANESKSGGDACATLAWMQLNLNLLRVTGEPQYAEQLEHTAYNQLFAAQDANTGAIFEPAPLNGSKQPAAPSDSCVASEAQGIAMLPAEVWGRFDSGIAVLLYNAGRGTFQLRRRGTVQLYAESGFPETGEYLLHVEPSRNLRFPLRLRVPEWTNNFTVDVGATHLNGKPGDFLTLNREWKPGDSVRISMDMTVRVLTGSADYPDRIAVQRGPQVLALAEGLNPELKDLSEAALLTADASRPKLTPLTYKFPSNWPGDQAYAIAGEYEGKVRQLTLAPFADARTYRVWLRRPSASTGATK